MLVQEKGEVYHDCPTQQKSFVPMPEIMNSKKKNNVQLHGIDDAYNVPFIREMFMLYYETKRTRKSKLT